jgi:hypothetical protein
VAVDVPAGLRLVSACASGQPAAADAAAGQDGLGGQEPGAVKLHYHLAGFAFAAWDLIVQAPAGAAAARHFVTAMIIDDTGQLLEDAAVIAVGEVDPPSVDVPLGDLLPALETISGAEAAEAELTSLTGHLELPPGGRGEIAVNLSNTTATELRGEAQLISPHGSWAALERWSTGFSVDPGGQVLLSFAVTVPRDARPGSRWWALAKIMYFGRLRYSEPVWITVSPGAADR